MTILNDILQKIRSVVNFYPGYAEALVDLFPEIGLDINKFVLSSMSH